MSVRGRHVGRARSSRRSCGSKAGAEPVQDHRRARAGAAPRGRRARSRRPTSRPAARWRLAISTDTGAVVLGEVQLLHVGVDHGLQADGRVRRRGRCSPPTTSAPPTDRASAALRRDQLAGGLRVQAHVALGGVHRVGDAEPPRPQVVAERQGGVPVDGRRGRRARSRRRAAGRRARPRRRRGERSGPDGRRRAGAAASGDGRTAPWASSVATRGHRSPRPGRAARARAGRRGRRSRELSRPSLGQPDAAGAGEEVERRAGRPRRRGGGTAPTAP